MILPGIHQDHNLSRRYLFPDSLQDVAQLGQVDFYEGGSYPEISGDGWLVDGLGGILLHRVPVIFHIRFGLGRRTDTKFNRVKAVLLVKSPTVCIDLERI